MLSTWMLIKSFLKYSADFHALGVSKKNPLSTREWTSFKQSINTLTPVFGFVNVLLVNLL